MTKPDISEWIAKAEDDFTHLNRFRVILKFGGFLCGNASSYLLQERLQGDLRIRQDTGIVQHIAIDASCLRSSRTTGGIDPDWRLVVHQGHEFS